MEIPCNFNEASSFFVSGSILIRNKSILSGQPWRMPHLTEIGSEREPLRLSWAVKSERKIRIQLRSTWNS